MLLLLTSKSGAILLCAQQKQDETLHDGATLHHNWKQPQLQHSTLLSTPSSDSDPTLGVLRGVAQLNLSAHRDQCHSVFLTKHWCRGTLCLQKQNL